MESVECLVVGAGVIGLAVARALARAGREVVVVVARPGGSTTDFLLQTEKDHGVAGRECRPKCYGFPATPRSFSASELTAERTAARDPFQIPVEQTSTVESHCS